jgi:hypothetical protein
MTKQETKDFMRSSIDSIAEILESRGLESNLSKGENNLYSYINGVKVEWQIGDATMRIGYSNSTEDIQAIGRYVSDLFDPECVNTLKNWVDIKPPTVDAFLSLVDWILDMEIELEKPARGRGSSQNQSGVLFEGSDFSNAHERMITMGGRFMNMVCKASGMSMNYDSEWPIKDDGRIDAVELDMNNNPISIVECQSGIQHGKYLDSEHFSKSLLRYPLDRAILPTLKKIVILAGGYSEDHLFKIKVQAEMFANRENPIDVILLQTTRNKNKIGVELVNYK